MRRTDRLFELIQLFRDGRLQRGQDLAEKLEVSLRTIYRDIDTLVASGVAIEGERGVGYILRQPIFLPPLNLTYLELEALHLGISMVQKTADEELSGAGKDLLAKIDAVLPSDRPRSTHHWGMAIYNDELQGTLQFMPVLRRSISTQRIIQLEYESLDGERSKRAIRPLQLEFWGKVWTCTAWCEARDDFRVFRVDRIVACKLTDQVFDTDLDKSLEAYLARFNIGSN